MKIKSINLFGTSNANISTLTIGCDLEGKGGNDFKVYIPNIANLFDFSYEIEIDNPVETLLGKQKNTASLLLEVINQAGEISNVLSAEKGPSKKDVSKSEVLRSSWSQLPAFKGIKPLTFSSQLDIEYYFGQSGEFSAESEVYNNGVKLINSFLPTDQSGTIAQSLLPLSGAMLAKSALNMYNSVTKSASKSEAEGKIIGTTVSKGETSTTVEEETGSADISSAYNGLKTIVSNFNSSVADAYKDKHGIFCKIKYGSLCSPVFFPKGFSMNFDCSEMVGNNAKKYYPLKVTISLKSCQTPELTTKNLIDTIISKE